MPLDINALRGLIGMGESEQVFPALLAHFQANPNPVQLNKLLAMQGRLADYKSNLGAGINTDPNAPAEVRMGLLQLLNDLEAGNSGNGGEVPPAGPPLFVIVYDPADTEHFKQLSKHLKLLVLSNKLRVHDIQDSRFDGAHVDEGRKAIAGSRAVIALLSLNLFGTEWYDLVEEARAGGKTVVPVKLEELQGFEEFELVKLKSLPSQKRSVREFANTDLAYTDIVSELKKLL
ncbi:MAG: hypothetical protein JNL02_17770 [Saprospiraceae bacterium]|nr:hypothetical protein [Saprospiraceae bacterium]